MSGSGEGGPGEGGLGEDGLGEGGLGEERCTTTKSFGTRDAITVDDVAFQIERLDRLDGVDRFPYSLKVLLENLLRNEDGRLVTSAQIEALLSWRPGSAPAGEVAFTPARVLMQDFTGVPCVVDLVAMRDAIVELGGCPHG